MGWLKMFRAHIQGVGKAECCRGVSGPCSLVFVFSEREKEVVSEESTEPGVRE